MVAQQLPKAWISDNIMELPSFWIVSCEGEVVSDQVSAIYLGIFDYVFAVPDDKILQKLISLLVTKKRLPSGGDKESTSIGTAYISLSSHSAVHQLCYLRRGLSLSELKFRHLWNENDNEARLTPLSPQVACMDSVEWYPQSS